MFEQLPPGIKLEEWNSSLSNIDLLSSLFISLISPFFSPSSCRRDSSTLYTKSKIEFPMPETSYSFSMFYVVSIIFWFKKIFVMGRVKKFLMFGLL